MSRPAGHEAGDDGGATHALDELAQLAGVLDTLMDMNMGSGMALGEFDGFVAAVAVCPDTVPPSEWLAEVWGPDPVFAHPSDADATLRALLGHYNRVARVLAEAPETYTSVFDMDADGTEVWWDGWVEGFDRGMRLRPKSWEPMFKNGCSDASMALDLLYGLCRLVQGGACPGLTEAIADDIDRLANNLIPHFVIWLNAWKNGTETTGAVEPYTWTMPGELRLHGVRADAREPCPCGSGRVYGRCCALH